MYAAAFDFLAEIFAWPLTFFYEITGSYGLSIMLITVVVMAITTPLTLKSTKGMLEMQKLQPQMRRLQQQYRGDRQKLNEEMMKLYQEHKVNPLASCFPLLLQMPVFFGMFSLLRGLTLNTDPETGNFVPRIINESSQLYKDLSQTDQMNWLGLDLSKSPQQMFDVSVGKGVVYVLLVVLLGFLYWVQQRMVANRSVSPTMSPVQAKIMQYLPVAFAGFQIFFPLGLVVYYITQTVLRIGQQYYITRRFYRGDESLGRQAHAAGQEARELAKADKSAKAVRPADPGGRAGSKPAKPTSPAKGAKGRPAPSGRPPRPQTPTKTPPKASAKAPAAGRPAPTKPTKPVKPTKPTKPTKPDTA